MRHDNATWDGAAHWRARAIILPAHSDASARDDATGRHVALVGLSHMPRLFDPDRCLAEVPVVPDAWGSGHRPGRRRVGRRTCAGAPLGHRSRERPRTRRPVRRVRRHPRVCRAPTLVGVPPRGLPAPVAAPEGWWAGARTPFGIRSLSGGASYCRSIHPRDGAPAGYCHPPTGAHAALPSARLPKSCTMRLPRRPARGDPWRVPCAICRHDRGRAGPPPHHPRAGRHRARLPSPGIHAP